MCSSDLPRTGYSTRWLGTIMSIFFPPDTTLHAVLADGEPLEHESLEDTSMAIKGVLDRPVLRHSLLVPPDGSGKLVVTYAVPHAAKVAPDGDMTYQVALDPQDLVRPQSNTINLTIPPGYRFGPLPAGWSLTSSHTALLLVRQLTESSSWRVPILKD